MDEKCHPVEILYRHIAENLHRPISAQEDLASSDRIMGPASSREWLRWL